MITVSKQSVRTLTQRERLPKKFQMYVGGSFLFDVLEANGLSEKIHLWNQVYWITCKSVNNNQLKIHWRNEK